jgi:hypothetical protein
MTRNALPPTSTDGVPSINRTQLADALRQLQAATGAVLACIENDGALADGIDTPVLKVAAARLGKSPKTVLRWAIRNGAAIKDGARWRIDMKLVGLKERP